MWCFGATKEAGVVPPPGVGLRPRLAPTVALACPCIVPAWGCVGGQGGAAVPSCGGRHCAQPPRWCIDTLLDGAPRLPPEVDRCGASPDCGGCHCAQPPCWCIGTLRSRLVVVVFARSLCARALMPCLAVRLICFQEVDGCGAGSLWCPQASSGAGITEAGCWRPQASLPGLGVVGRFQLLKLAIKRPMGRPPGPGWKERARSSP